MDPPPFVDGREPDKTSATRHVTCNVIHGPCEVPSLTRSTTPGAPQPSRRSCPHQRRRTSPSARSGCSPRRRACGSCGYSPAATARSVGSEPSPAHHVNDQPAPRKAPSSRVRHRLQTRPASRVQRDRQPRPQPRRRSPLLRRAGWLSASPRTSRAQSSSRRSGRPVEPELCRQRWGRALSVRTDARRAVSGLVGSRQVQRGKGPGQRHFRPARDRPGPSRILAISELTRKRSQVQVLYRPHTSPQVRRGASLRARSRI